LPKDYHTTNGLSGAKSAAPHGEKQWQKWAQDLNDHGDALEEAANNRIPY